MKERPKKISKISPSVKRLIAKEALYYPEMPRDYLVQVLTEKIQSMGQIPPTEETLKRRISDARQHPPSFSLHWHLGLQLEDGIGNIPVEAIPRMIEIQRVIKEKLGLTEYIKMPVYVAFWIGKLYKVVDDPMALFEVAYAYALYVIVGQAADKNVVAVDTSELDNLLFNKDYESLTAIAKGFMIRLRTEKVEDVGNDFPNIMERLKEAMKKIQTEEGDRK